MNVLFHSNQLGIRGTEVALYEYADYNESILGNTSYVAAPANSDLQTLDKFKSRFEDKVILYNTFSDLFSLDVKAAYFIKYGTNDGLLLPNARNIVHYVFDGSQPHGDVYVGVSEWLSERYKTDSLPHIVKMPDISDEVRKEYRKYFNISEEDIVFGRHGGEDQFDVPYLKRVVEASADKGKKFIFMNTRVFTAEHPNIIYLSPTYDLELKAAFINTCDAMLHGRTEGESFGLSVCEFLYYNKPVISNIVCRDRNHICILKEKGYYYSSDNELYSILMNFKKNDYVYRNHVDQFSPDAVMKKFNYFLNE